MDFAVIMAGGTGKRLWPLSREDASQAGIETSGRRYVAS